MNPEATVPAEALSYAWTIPFLRSMYPELEESYSAFATTTEYKPVEPEHRFQAETILAAIQHHAREISR